MGDDRYVNIQQCNWKGNAGLMKRKIHVSIYAEVSMFLALPLEGKVDFR